jgi:hypothetical protein
MGTACWLIIGRVRIVDLGAGLSHDPVDVQVEWRSKVVATRIPVVGEHQEWSIEVDLSCPSGPILLALLLRDAHRAVSGRLGKSSAAQRVHVRLSFFPYRWYETDEVQVSFYQRGAAHGAGIRVAITDHQLKLDPREALRTAADYVGTVATGTAFRLAEAENLGIVAELITVAADDTEASHGRWRLRPAHAASLPAEYDFLLTGLRTGAPR